MFNIRQVVIQLSNVKHLSSKREQNWLSNELLSRLCGLKNQLEILSETLDDIKIISDLEPRQAEHQS